MAVFFHGSFGLNRRLMSGIARLALEGPELSDTNLAGHFDYGAPFAAKQRNWLHKTGIGNLGSPFTLTELGRVVWRYDPELKNTITKWFMHHELANDPERAEAWHFFIHDFKPTNNSFTRADLQKSLMMKLRYHDEAHFGPNSKMNPIIVLKLIECYTAPEGLGDLGILKTNDGLNFHFRSGNQGPWKTPRELTKAYTNPAN